MRLSHFFIERPVFAAVVAILITLVGAIAFPNLPVAQYPNIAPPTVNVTANYPGASAEVLADTVAAPIEESINGVENMLYLSSQSTGDGHVTITVTFKLGTDPNQAQVLVENRVATATPLLPSEVVASGVTVRKSSPDFLMAVHNFSPDGSLDQKYIANYVGLHVFEMSCCGCPASATSARGRRAITPCGSGSIPISRGGSKPDCRRYRGSAARAEHAGRGRRRSDNRRTPRSRSAYQLNVEALGRLSTAGAIRRHHCQDRHAGPA